MTRKMKVSPLTQTKIWVFFIIEKSLLPDIPASLVNSAANDPETTNDSRPQMISNLDCK